MHKPHSKPLKKPPKYPKTHKTPFNTLTLINPTPKSINNPGNNLKSPKTQTQSTQTLTDSYTFKVTIKIP